ncbi:MAG: hypothetical protein ACJA0O_000714, partial [Porticoccus sp.]
YACLALVVNMAAGLSEERISFGQMDTVMANSMPLVRMVLTKALASPQH